MKKTNIIFWTFTVIFCGLMLFSASSEIINNADAKEFINKLGYPSYFNPFLGVLKLLGVVALLVPGFPRIKEWAYAGFFFDLFGATYSQIAVGGFRPEIAFMLLFFIFWGLSYVYSHKRVTNQSPATGNL